MQQIHGKDFQVDFAKCNTKFNGLDKKAKRFLTSQNQTALIKNVEVQLLAYLDNEQTNWQPLNLGISDDDGMERFITHAICHFYGFSTESHNVSYNKRVVMVKKPFNLLHLPPIKLTTFLSLHNL